MSMLEDAALDQRLFMNKKNIRIFLPVTLDREKFIVFKSNFFTEAVLQSVS